MNGYDSENMKSFDYPNQEQIPQQLMNDLREDFSNENNRQSYAAQNRHNYQIQQSSNLNQSQFSQPGTNEDDNSVSHVMSDHQSSPQRKEQIQNQNFSPSQMGHQHKSAMNQESNRQSFNQQQNNTFATQNTQHSQKHNNQSQLNSSQASHQNSMKSKVNGHQILSQKQSPAQSAKSQNKFADNSVEKSISQISNPHTHRLAESNTNNSLSRRNRQSINTHPNASQLQNHQPSNFPHSTSRFNILDREERDLINQAANLSKEEIWEKLEQKRFNQLKKAAVNLQSEMLFNNRCPKCTLQPPCKHYSSPEQIIQDGTHIVLRPGFKEYLSPKKREVIIKSLREQQKAQQFFNQQQLYQQSQEMMQNQSQISHNSSHPHNQRVDSKENSANLSNASPPLPESKGAFLTSLEQQLPESQTHRHPNAKTLNNLGAGSSPQPGKFPHRNMFNNTVSGAAMNAFKNQSTMLQGSNLSQYGANIMSQQNQFIPRRQYLKKRQGNGGSPTGLDGIHNESKISKDGPLIPKNLQNQIANDRDKTTVRIRTKNNQFVYAEGSFGQGGANNSSNPQSFQYSFMENSQQSLYQRERLQAVIAKYKEEKIQKQIERIEQERMQLEFEKQIQREQEMKRRQYIEKQKQKLAEYQSVREQKDGEKYEQEKLERQRWIERERLRKNYFDSQRKFISDYREQKKKTDELLMIPSHYQQKSIPGYFSQGQSYNIGASNNQQVQNSAIMTKAGQQFISGHGKVQKNAGQHGGGSMSGMGAIVGADFQEDDYDEYYGEIFPENMGGSNNQQPKKKNTNSTGVIGQQRQEAENMNENGLDQQASNELMKQNRELMDLAVNE